MGANPNLGVAGKFSLFSWIDRRLIDASAFLNPSAPALGARQAERTFLLSKSNSDRLGSFPAGEAYARRIMHVACILFFSPSQEETAYVLRHPFEEGLHAY